MRVFRKCGSYVIDLTSEILRMEYLINRAAMLAIAVTDPKPPAVALLCRSETVWPVMLSVSTITVFLLSSSDIEDKSARVLQLFSKRTPDRSCKCGQGIGHNSGVGHAEISPVQMSNRKNMLIFCRIQVS